MAAERLSMRQIREILRQKWTLGRNHREVAQSLGVSLGTVSSVERRAQAAGLDWSEVQGLTEEAPEARLYGAPTSPTHHRPGPDWAVLHAERRKPGIALELLHLEYLEHIPTATGTPQFCELYRRWLHRRGLSMRQVHHAGDTCFVDYAGKKPRIIELTTGEVAEVELFAAVLGASNYTYAEASRTQQVLDWLASHQRAFHFFGDVTSAVVCEQLKSGVVIPCRYEPGLQRTYEESAQHYGTAMLPARPAKPRDKTYASYCTLSGCGSDERRRLRPAAAAAFDDRAIRQRFKEASLVLAIRVTAEVLTITKKRGIRDRPARRRGGLRGGVS